MHNSLNFYEAFCSVSVMHDKFHARVARKSILASSLLNYLKDGLNDNRAEYSSTCLLEFQMHIYLDFIQKKDYPVVMKQV